MPHIHTEPDQHDMTVSAYVVLRDGDTWKCLVHMHKKLNVYMQIGGHIELTETPWQALEHELLEESGYTLAELQILQPGLKQAVRSGSVSHPIPYNMNTHTAGEGHFHSDTCYAFVAKSIPKRPPNEDESQNLKWLTMQELEELVTQKKTLLDVIEMYDSILTDGMRIYSQQPASEFSLKKPSNLSQDEDY